MLGRCRRPDVIDYRNPTLAEAMRVLGLVQRYGFTASPVIDPAEPRR